MNLDKFIKEKIAIRFANKDEMIEFLKECDKNGLTWKNGMKAISYIPFDWYKNDTCIRYSNNLLYGDFDYYTGINYKIIDYKDFKKGDNNFFNFKEIKRIVANKNATIVFWSDDTKTIVKRNKNQQNNHELAILYAYFIKHSNLSKTSAKKVIQALVDNIYVQGGKR